MQVTTKANTVIVLHTSALCSELGSSCQYLRFAWGITWDLTASISLSLSQIPGWTWRKSTLRTWRRKLPAVFSATEQFPVWYTLAPGIPQWREALGPMAVAVLMILFYWERFFFSRPLSHVTLPQIASQITCLHSRSHPQFFLVSSLGCFFFS